MNKPVFLTRAQRVKPAVIRVALNLLALALFAGIGVLLAWRG